MAFQSHPSTPPTPPSQSSSAGAAHLPTPWRRSWRSLLSPNTSSNPLPPRSALLAWATAPLTALILFAPTPPAWAQTRCRGLDEISSRCTTIWLDNRNLSSLPEGIFRGLNNLEELELHNNNLSSLPEGIFRGLNNLEELSLSRNNLSSLPAGIFRGLNNLEELYLYDNNLSSLPEGIFRGLNNLELLSLYRNNLSSLPEGIFRGLNNLERLWLYDNNLRSLPEGIFRGLNNLELLHLYNNNLRSLPEGIFRGLNNLRGLSLWGNNLSCLPELPSSLLSLNVDGDNNNDINDPGLPPCEEEEIEIIINEQTLRIDDPLSQVDFAAVLKKVADVASGQIVKSKATRRTSTSRVGQVIDEIVEEAEMVVEEVEMVVEEVEYELDKASYISAAADLLIRGEVRTFIQNELDERTGTEEYTVHLEKKPEGNVEVRITSSHPDAFVITPETLTFTPDNYNSPQTVRVRPAFTVANYVDGTVPDLSTLSHSASSGGAPEEVQIGVIGSQPISEHVSSALVQIVEEIGLYDLFCLIPKARVVCSVVSLGQRIAGVIEDAVEFAQQIGQQISDGLEPFFGDDEAVEAAKAYEEGGTAGLTDHLDEQLASSEVDPVASVSTQPGVAVQSRLGARSAPGGGSAVGNSDLSFLDQVLERSAHFLVTHQQEFNAGGFDIHHALSLVGTDFKVPLSSLGIAQQDAATGAAAAATRNMVLWGSVDYSQFGDSADNFSIDGANWTFTVGVDGHLKPDLLAGVALSRSSARSDYDYFGAAMGGDHDVNLTVFSPYLNWFASDQLGFWASVGYGKGSSRFSLSRIGDLDLSSIEGLDQSATRKEQDSDFFSLSTGLRWEAFRAEATQVSFKLAGSTTTFLERDSQQGRIAAQVSREFPSPNGVLSSSLDLAMLLASTDSAAMEAVAGLDWAAANDKFSASTVARSLVFSGDRYEWGLGAALNYQAGVRPGEGLSLSLKPTFGVTASHLTELDIFSPSEDGELAFQPWQPNARLKTRLDYGIPSGAALLTPYTEFSMSHSSTVYGAGLRYQLDTSLDLDLNASRRSRSSGTNENRVFLQLRSDL